MTVKWLNMNAFLQITVFGWKSIHAFLGFMDLDEFENYLTPHCVGIVAHILVFGNRVEKKII